MWLRLLLLQPAPYKFDPVVFDVSGCGFSKSVEGVCFGRRNAILPRCAIFSAKRRAKCPRRDWSLPPFVSSRGRSPRALGPRRSFSRHAVLQCAHLRMRCALGRCPGGDVAGEFSCRSCCRKCSFLDRSSGIDRIWLTAYGSQGRFTGAGSAGALGAQSEVDAAPRNVPLFDTVGFTRHLEAAYISMYERHQRGEAPETLVVARTAGEAPMNETLLESARSPAARGVG